MTGFVHSENFKYIVGLLVGWLGIVIGWVLQETSHSLSERRERRRAISLALTDLLEIQLHFRAIDTMIEKVSQLTVLPEQARAQVWLVFERFLPDSTELHKRYNDSVSVVASLDPKLGFQLRSKDLMRPLFSFLNSVAAQDAKAAALWLSVQKPLMQETYRALSNAVDELAKEHSRSTHRWVRERAARANEVPKEVEQWLNSVMDEVKRQNVPTAPQAQAAHSAPRTGDTNAHDEAGTKGVAVGTRAAPPRTG